MQEDPRAPTKGVAALADLPLRRGKWTDEQNYSELLIQRVGRRLFFGGPPVFRAERS